MCQPHPHHSPGQDNGCLCPASRIQRAGPAPAGSPPAVPAATPSWDHVCQAAWPSQGSPCPRQLQRAPSRGLSPPGQAWGVPAGSHHSAPPVALHGEVRAEEQVRDGQEQGLGQRPGVLIIVLCLLGTRPPEAPQSWLAKERRSQDLGSRWRTGSAQAGTHGGGGEEAGGEGTGSAPLITPNLPRQKGDSREQGWEHSGGLPSDWEGPGESPKLESLSPAENYWARPPNTTHPQLPGQNPREGVG